jgi:hypothetical protein
VESTVMPLEETRLDDLDLLAIQIDGIPDMENLG